MDTRSDKSRTVSFEVPTASPTIDSAAVFQDADDENHFDPLAGSTFVVVNPAPPPIKHRPDSTYNTYQRLNAGNSITSFHKISIATKSQNARDSFFYKENQQNSPYMPELESYSWGCYHLLTPRYAPASTRPIYDLSRSDPYIGVSSKAIPGFKSTKDAQLQLKDLQLPILDAGVSIEDMEDIDQSSLTDPDFDTRDDDDPLTDVHVSNDRSVTVTVDDLKKYRIARGLGCSLTASYIFKEDDLHRGNMSKQGERIDFDMSNWPILSIFKSSSFFDGIVRKRNVETRFTIHADDIRSFPHLNHATPYYWPTKPTNFSNKLVQAVSFNPWGPEENAVYQQLSKSPVFNHFKYQTFLKFMLTSADHYRAIAEAHIRPELRHENKSIIDMLVEDQGARIESIKSTLTDMPEFAEFMERDGDNAFKRIHTEIQISNRRYQEKIDKADLMLRKIAENNHEDIVAIAKKLRIVYVNMTDSTIKEQISRVLKAKKEAYLNLMICEQKLIADFSTLRNTVLNIKNQQAKLEEQKLIIEQLQLQMLAQADVAISTVVSPTRSVK